MKKAIVSLALIMSMGLNQVSLASTAPKHRYTPSTEQVDNSDDNSSLDAYSDTTSVDTAYDDDSAYDANSDRTYHSQYSLGNYDDPFDFVGSVFGKGALWCIGIFTVIFTLLFVFAPLIIILLIIRYLYRRHQDRMRLAEMAMDKGVNIPESARPIDRQSSDYLMKRGIRNACLGFGLAIMFAIWGSRLLAGFSALVLCYGVGQILISLLPIIRKFFQKDPLNQNSYYQNYGASQNNGTSQNQGTSPNNGTSQNQGFNSQNDFIHGDFVKNDDADAPDKQQ